MNINPSPSNSINSTPVKLYNDHQFLITNSPTIEYSEESTSDSSNTITTNTLVINTTPVYQQNGLVQQRTKPQQQQTLSMPYDPLIHTNNKPPYSFSCLIFMAIEDSIQKALPVKEIYAWILDHFPYFKNAPTGWKNSVRHNLSLNKCFQKVEKAPVSILAILTNTVIIMYQTFVCTFKNVVNFKLMRPYLFFKIVKYRASRNSPTNEDRRLLR